MRSKKRTIGILIVVIVVLLGFAGSLLIYRNKLSSEKTKNNSNNNTAKALSSAPSGKSIENFYDKPITDEKIALDSIEVNRDKLGYSDENFTFIYDEKSGSKTAYHFDLYYKDIPVYSPVGIRGVSVITYYDNSADVLITGVSDSEKIVKINTIPKITQDEALDIAKETLGEKFSEYNIGVGFKQVKVSPKLTIYECNDKYELAYYVRTGSYLCVINAENGEIIECHSVLVSNSAEYEGQNGDIHQIFYDDYKDEENDIKDMLWNKDKNIVISDYPIRFMSLSDIQYGKNKSAVDAMANTYRAVEYFDSEFGVSFDNTMCIINVNGDCINNAKGIGTDDEEGSLAFIYIGERTNKEKAQYSAYLDIVAHEYTHAVTDIKAFGSGYKSDRRYFERNSLMEAYSDIFGELVEREYTGNNDWKHNNRNIKNPQIEKYSERYQTNDSEGNDNNDYGGAHWNSTIISHAAYLMSKDHKSIKHSSYGSTKNLLDYNQLAQLWYGSLIYLKDMHFQDFSDCRYAVEKSARKLIKEGVLLEDNLKVIEQAFNEVEVSSNPARRGAKDSAEIKENHTLVVPIEDETQSSEPMEIEEIEITEPTTTAKTEQTTTTTEPISTIPEDACIYNGHSYMVYPESMTWKESKEYCENLGGHLLTISDAEEQKYIEDLAEKYVEKTSYWLGGYYENSMWKWVDDTAFSYTNWDSWTDGIEEYKQPDNHTGNEFYLRFANQKIQYSTWYSNKGKWNDVSNEADGSSGDVPINSFGLICEWDNTAEISEDN